MFSTPIGADLVLHGVRIMKAVHTLCKSYTCSKYCPAASVSFSETCALILGDNGRALGLGWQPWQPGFDSAGLWMAFIQCRDSSH